MGSRGEKHQLRQSSLEKLTILPTGILTGSQTTQRQEYSHWLLLSAQARLASQRNAGKKQRGPRRTTRKWQQKWQAGKVAVERAKALGWLRFEREARDEETKVRPALQAGGRQCIIIPWLQKPRERQGAVPFLASELEELSPGGDWALCLQQALLQGTRGLHTPSHPPSEGLSDKRG